MDDPVLQLAIVGRMALAALFGFLIGFERELRRKSAGQRTLALVALGSAGVTAVGVELFPASAEKVMAGVITGVGFIGVGIIWRAGEGQARGLTTAAATWAVAAIAVAVGSGLYLAGALGTALALGLLLLDRVPGLGNLPERLSEDDEPPASPDG